MQTKSEMIPIVRQTYFHHVLRLTVMSVVALLMNSQTMFAAEFEYPLAVVVDKQGSIFVADRKLPGIWKISEGKTEVFFQGSKKFRTPLNAVRCLALDEQGNLLAGDSATREIYRFSSDGKPTPLTQGKIGIPMAIAVNSTGDIYVSDLEIRSIVTVPKQGGTPELFVAGLPVHGLAFEGDGHLLAVVHAKNQVLRIAADKKIEVLISERLFQFPHNIAVDDSGNRYIADGYAKTIWKISTDSAKTKPTAFIAHETLKNPVGLTWHDKQLYVADPKTKAILIFDQSGKMTSRFPK